MAVSSTTVFQGSDTFIADIEATANADTGISVPHGLSGGVPVEAHLTNLLQESAALSKWAVVALTDTSVTLGKSTAVGSGDVGGQVRVIVKRPNTYGR